MTFKYFFPVLLAVCFTIPLYSQVPGKDNPVSKDNAVQKNNFIPAEITDVFALNAVTFEEMAERASHLPYMPQELVVALLLETSKPEALSVLRSYEWPGIFKQQNVQLKEVLMAMEREPGRTVALAHLALPTGLDVVDAMKMADGAAGVLWSSPNFYYEGDPREIIPNDPSYGSQYHHPLMQNNLAWDITFGSPTVIIGITDDGVELAHSDLSPNIWTNPGETPNDNLDNDGNGFIDDVNGWDFDNNDNNPNPTTNSDDHGTHVAGISAARTNNGIGVAGVSGHSTILPLKFCCDGSWTAAKINATFSYAADNGAKIVNTSYNIDGWVGDPVFTAGLQYLYDNNVLHCNSAGNNNTLNPPRQAFHQTLLVASTTSADVKSSFSNYGTGIDVAAPGSSIFSTVTANGYGTKSGTSMATPNAAGVAALIWSANPAWTRDQVAAQLLATANNIDAQNPGFIGLLGSGRVNSNQALTTTLAPPKVKSLTGLPNEGGTGNAASITAFTVAFDQIMNPFSVNNLANFELRNAGLNGLFGDADDVVYPLTTTGNYMIGTNSKSYQIGNLPLNCGLYRLTLFSGGLENPFGTDLDGDGNGTGGDAFVRNFTAVDALYYLDGDGDGYGAGPAANVCPPPANYVLLDGDCDDTDPNVNPGEAEICNNEDDNCDGQADEGITQDHFFDSDNDGYGAGTPVSTCAPAQMYVLLDGDCDDTLSEINPAATELCNGLDDDCNGVVDFPPLVLYNSTNVPIAIASSGTPTVVSTLNISGAAGNIVGVKVKNLHIPHTWVGDLKATLTSPGGTTLTLFDRPGVTTSGFGCSQNNLLVSFDDAATSTAIDFENTCNTSSSTSTYAISGDYQPVNALAAFNGTDPNGLWTLTVMDVEGGDGGSIEAWGLEISTPGVLATLYRDLDGDDFGDANNSLLFNCTPAPGVGYVADNTDCNDADPAINPAAQELCDGLDNDCSGQPEGASNTWNGLGDGLFWPDGNNWSEGFFPLPCQDVIIPIGSTVQVPANFHARGKTLEVTVQGDLEVDPDGILQIEN